MEVILFGFYMLAGFGGGFAYGWYERNKMPPNDSTKLLKIEMPMNARDAFNVVSLIKVVLERVREDEISQTQERNDE